MAIMPHCVVCPWGPDNGPEHVAGEVKFANYNPRWLAPRTLEGYPVSWSNEVGVTAPDGVGLFCATHIKRARKLRRLKSEDAVARMKSEEMNPASKKRWWQTARK